MWGTRLQSCQRNVEVWQQILAVRSLVLTPKEDIPTCIQYAALARKSGRLALSLNVLQQLMIN
jgi:FKBP12-rapamycin complex-associated protein